MEIINAQIKSTMLGYEDHGIFTAYLTIEWPGGGVSFGGYGLDAYDDKLKRRVDSKGYGLEFIRQIMSVVDVECWENLKGKYIRIKSERAGGRVIAIGSLLNDKWFEPQQWFKDMELSS